MQDAAHVSAIRTAVGALNSGDLDGYFAAFVPECLRWVPGLPEPLSLAEIRASIEALRRGFADLSLKEQLLFGDDRYVCAHWHITGKHSGDYLDLAPTGRSIAVQSAEIYEFERGEGGLVCASWSFGDPSDLLSQLGALRTGGRAKT